MVNFPQNLPFDLRFKILGYCSLVVFSFLHMIPAFFDYSVLSGDLYKVMHVLNYLREPVLFGGNRLSELLVSSATSTAPIYFYVLGYPLSLVLSSNHVVLVIGFSIMCGTIYLAGGQWSDWEDFLVATVITLVLVHLFVSPIEGNRRSFTGIFLVSLIWLEDDFDFLRFLFLVALSAGIYPPVSLVMMSYFGLKNFFEIIEKRSTWGSFVVKTIVMVAVFLMVLMPYWFHLVGLSSDGAVLYLSSELDYLIGGPGELINTFVVGSQSALFRDQLQFDLFLILSVLLVVEVVVLYRRFILARGPIYLVGACLLTWGVSHLVHPMAYQPFKYTRLGLPLALAVPFARNLPDCIARIRSPVKNNTLLRIVLLLVGLSTLPALIYGYLYPGGWGLAEVFFLTGSNWWKFLFSIPLIMLVLSVFAGTQVRTILVSGLVAVIIFVTVFLPHPDRTQYAVGVPLTELGELYDYLGTTPKGTLVGGPSNKLMDPVPAFAKRGVFVSGNTHGLKLVCDRTRQLSEVYFSESPREIYEFLDDNNIDYFLVDRHLLENFLFWGPSEKCIGEIRFSENAYLNRHFEDAVWRYGKRLYLIDPERTLLEDSFLKH